MLTVSTFYKAKSLLTKKQRMNIKMCGVIEKIKILNTPNIFLTLAVLTSILITVGFTFYLEEIGVQTIIIGSLLFYILPSLIILFLDLQIKELLILSLFRNKETLLDFLFKIQQQLTTTEYKEFYSHIKENRDFNKLVISFFEENMMKFDRRSKNEEKEKKEKLLEIFAHNNFSNS